MSRMNLALAITAIVALLITNIDASTIHNQGQWTHIKQNIKHVIYLMMENRSFDHIAGFWKFHPGIDNLANLKTPFCNEYTNPNWTVWGEPLMICAKPYEAEVPLKDPDHAFAGVSYQIYRKWDPTKTDVPNMGGFIERQSEQYQETPGEASYFAEHPGSTNPNRQFATSGSSCGFVDSTTQSVGFFRNTTGMTCAKSIFESLSNKGITWKNYYESVTADAWLYKWTQDNALDHLVHADQLFRDLEEGTLPQFSYYNPECCNVTSMHPKSNMAAGEQMIKHLYDAVRNSQYWDNVLIVINFDEHGGFADHVTPPVDIPVPEDGISFSGISENHNITYDFSRLGVRVPAFLISPWIPANTLIHDQGTMYEHNSAYTHTSILHFIQELWDLEGLNNRVQWAKTFEYVFSDRKRTNTPTNLTAPTWYGGRGGTQPYPFYLLNQPYSYYASIGAI
ncbi:hypothetical protein B7463_g9100, partial [Scytalidium lignicola]